MSSIGQRADEATPKVFARAAEEIGQVFEAIKTLPGKVIQINQKVAGVADDILRQQGKMIPSQRDQELIKLAQQAKQLAAHRGKIDGETYQLTRSGLSTAAFEAKGTNKALYGELLDALDDSADASLRAAGHGDLAMALKVARPQYKSLLMLEKGAVAEGGKVSPARVASVMRTQDPSGFRRGKTSGPLRDIAAIGEGLPPLRAGSPTAEREAISNPLSLVANAMWSYPLARATTSPVMTAFPSFVGSSPATRQVLQLTQPSARAAIAAELAKSRVLPFAPVAVEQQ